MTWVVESPSDLRLGGSGAGSGAAGPWISPLDAENDLRYG